MRLRRLNRDGIERLSAFIDSLSTEAPESYPATLLLEPEWTEPVAAPVEVDPREFSNRFDAAGYLYELLDAADVTSPETDEGLWAWLALFYYEQLCPPDKNGRRKPGERARWVPAVGDFRRYYRHLLAGPYQVFKAHRSRPERTLALLCGPVHEVSGVYKEIAERQELVSNPTVVEAATRLYYNPQNRRVKRIGQHGVPGSPARFVQVLMQLDVAWDLYSMSAEDIIALLPEEFDRFRPQQRELDLDDD